MLFTSSVCVCVCVCVCVRATQVLLLLSVWSTVSFSLSKQIGRKEIMSFTFMGSYAYPLENN